MGFAPVPAIRHVVRLGKAVEPYAAALTALCEIWMER
ncbi:hypothetical protein FG93_03458 [Bosea sp. LC85]|nr:hypothetical protein FG93_03458 [Bosea sp. LC85]